MYCYIKESDSHTPLYPSHETNKKNVYKKGCYPIYKVCKPNCNYLFQNLQQQNIAENPAEYLANRAKASQ